MDVQVVFAVGETEQFVVVAIQEDSVLEGSEAFQAELSLPAGSTGVLLGQQSLATATIQDNDGT
jgi:predicted exporter